MAKQHYLRFRVWIEQELKIDEMISVGKAALSGERHAAIAGRALDEGKNYTVEISDPDQNDKVLVRFGTNPDRMEQPLRVETADQFTTLAAKIARDRLRKE